MKHRDYVAERLARDPEFREAWEAIEPEYQRARALIGARVAAGLTQAQLAQRLGMAQSAVARIESGRHPPKLDTLQAIAAATGATFAIAATGLRLVAPEGMTLPGTDAVPSEAPPQSMADGLPSTCHPARETAGA